jgi:hypothetical protein
MQKKEIPKIGWRDGKREMNREQRVAIMTPGSRTGNCYLYQTRWEYVVIVVVVDVGKKKVLFKKKNLLSSNFTQLSSVKITTDNKTEKKWIMQLKLAFGFVLSWFMEMIRNNLHKIRWEPLKISFDKYFSPNFLKKAKVSFFPIDNKTFRETRGFIWSGGKNH